MIGQDLARALDPAIFAEDCGITPDAWQRELLQRRPHRGLLLCSRQSGKTTTTGLLAAHTALYTPASLVVIVSPSLRQSSEMLRGVRVLLSRLPNAPEYDADSALKIELANRSRILALPGSGDTIRGLAAAKLVIADEACRITDDLWTAVRPMVAVSRGSIIALTTPGDAKSGFFHDAWHSGDPNWHRVKITADQCPRLSPDFLAEELRELGPSRFAAEYMCEWPDDNEMSVFPMHLINNLVDPNLKALWK
jgi:hypothetical protein